MQDFAFLELVDLCYEAVEQPAAWDQLVSKLAAMLNAQAGDLVVEDYVSGVATALGTIGFDPHFRRNYDVLFMGENGWINELKRLPLRKTYHDHAEPPDFLLTSYYNDWVRPQSLRHAMGALLENNDERLIHIGFLRAPQSKKFERGDGVVLDRLLPHLTRAIRLSAKFDEVGGTECQVTSALTYLRHPALVVNRHLEVMYMNRAAELFMKRTSVLGLGVRGLIMCCPTVNDKLHKLVDRACRLDEPDQSSGRQFVAIPPPDPTEPPIVIEAFPFRSSDVWGGVRYHCLLIVNDPSERLKDGDGILKQTWGLTQSEARLVREIANGETISEYCEARGISQSTARWHLKNAQSKMGVSNIAKVVQLVHGALRGA